MRNCRGNCSRLGANVGTLVKDKESLQQALDDAKARLVQLQALQAAAEARDAAAKSLAQRLRPLMETKRIEMATRDGQTVLVIPGSVLFESDRTERQAFRRSRAGSTGARPLDLARLAVSHRRVLCRDG